MLFATLDFTARQLHPCQAGLPAWLWIPSALSAPAAPPGRGVQSTLEEAAYADVLVRVMRRVKPYSARQLP